MRPTRQSAIALFCLATSAAAPALATAPPSAEKKVCGVSGSPAEKTVRTDAHVRSVASRGLNYLAQSSLAWTKQHNCFGCHVSGEEKKFDPATKKFEKSGSIKL